MGMQIAGLVGLFGGVLMGLTGWYFGRKKAAENRELDETHEYIWRKARSFSWYSTLVAIYIIFTLYLIGITMSIPMILSMLILVQLASWAIGGLVVSGQMYNWIHINRNFVIGTLIIALSVLIIILLVFMTKNIYYLLCALPFGIIGIYLINRSKQVN